MKETLGTNIVQNQPPTPPEPWEETEAAEWERIKNEVQNSTPLASMVPAIGGSVIGLRSGGLGRDVKRIGERLRRWLALGLAQLEYPRDTCASEQDNHEQNQDLGRERAVTHFRSLKAGPVPASFNGSKQWQLGPKAAF